MLVHTETYSSTLIYLDKCCQLIGQSSLSVLVKYPKIKTCLFEHHLPKVKIFNIIEKYDRKLNDNAIELLLF